MPQKTCFVVQGFGEKTDLLTGRKLNLDATYQVIKVAVEEAGLQCIRADEIQHTGIIDKPMYVQILEADLVIADLSTYNVNAAYELGVRYALRPHATIILAEKGFQNPFDFSHIVIRNYEHLGTDIGFSEALRLKQELQGLIAAILERPETDSPIYTFLPYLEPPRKADAESAPRTRGLEGEPAPDLGPTRGGPAEPAAADWSDQSAKELLDLAREAMRNDDFATARQQLQIVHRMRRNDPFVVQQLALATYKSEQPTPMDALLEAHQLLRALDPETTNDPETLGLWGAIHKRLWNLTEIWDHLEEAIAARERGFYLRSDYYNGIDLAFLLNVRAARTDEPAEAITDFVLANRIRRKVTTLCKEMLAAFSQPDPSPRQQATGERYWILATLWEAAHGLGETAESAHWEALARAAAPAAWMLETTEKQITRLTELLVDSPLRHLRIGP